MPGPTMTSGNAAAFSAASDNVFARIAGRYDFLCDIFSLYAHRLWKARMAELIAGTPAAVVLDVASGTGDIPFRLLRRLRRAPEAAPRRILVTDLCLEMLALAKRKIGAEPGVEFSIVDAHDLAGIPPGSVDLFSISFGMKICDRRDVVAEAFRVLRPGGVFLCLEAARIPIEWMHWAYLKYMDWCLPLIARLATRNDPGAYDYLLKGIHAFPSQAAFVREIEAHGFTGVSYENLTFGIVALHRGVKP
jgi:demethylmenaquinone methyltransferase/2-methoxy-6-polyprenyl-1,4-benzoquinol methylase